MPFGRLFRWNLLNLQPHSKPVIIREGLRSDFYQMVLPGMGFAIIEARDGGEIRLYTQAGLRMTTERLHGDGVSIKFEKESK